MQSRQAIASPSPQRKTVFTVKLLRNLNPHLFRSRFLSAPKAKGREHNSDAGFTLIETMGTIAIVAVLLLSAVPQLANAMEKAKVQTLVNDMNILSIQISGDQSLTGGGVVTLAPLQASCNAVTNFSSGNILKVAPNGTGDGFIITAYNPAVTHWVVTYDSAGQGAKIVAGAQTAFAKCS